MLDRFRSVRKFFGIDSPLVRSTNDQQCFVSQCFVSLDVTGRKDRHRPHQDSSPVSQNDTLKMFQLSRVDFAAFTLGPLRSNILLFGCGFAALRTGVPKLNSSLKRRLEISLVGSRRKLS
jgi:hypothetical protein